MAKIKFQVEPEAFDQTGFAEQPKPDVYEAKILEINAGYSKGEDGKEDKTRPRLEVIYEITDPKAATKGNDGGSAVGARIWDYVTFSASTKWKLAQFTRAFAGADKSKPSGEFDTAKLAEKITDIDKNGKKVTKETGHEGAKCKLRLRADSDQEGNYRAKVGSILPLSKDADAEESIVVDDDNMAEDVVEDEAGGEGYSEADLKALSVAELKEVVKAFVDAGYEIDIKGKKKSEVITLILEAQSSATENSEEDEELIDDDEEEMVDDDEESSGYSEEDLKAMSTDDLKEAAKNLNVVIKGKKKSEVIAAILEAQSSGDDGDSEASDSGDDDLPF